MCTTDNCLLNIVSYDWIKRVESTDVGPTLRADCNLLRKQVHKAEQVAAHKVGDTGKNAAQSGSEEARFSPAGESRR